MRGQTIMPDPPQQHEEGHVGQQTAISAAEDKVLRLTSGDFVQDRQGFA